MLATHESTLFVQVPCNRYALFHPLISGETPIIPSKTELYLGALDIRHCSSIAISFASSCPNGPIISIASNNSMQNLYFLWFEAAFWAFKINQKNRNYVKFYSNQ